MNMGKNKNETSLYVPLRNLIPTLLSVGVVSWYYADKLRSRRMMVAAIIVAAICAIATVAMISTRTRKTRRSFFWGIYNFLTGDGKLPLRLVSSATVFVVGMALLLHCAGVERSEVRPSSFIARFVEVDLYVAVLAFPGSTDPGRMSTGLLVVLAEIISIGGILFWGMYISILVNKHVEMLRVPKGDIVTGRADPLLYKEPAPTNERISRGRSRRRRGR